MTWHCARCGLVLRGGYIYRGEQQPEHAHPLQQLSEASGTIIRRGAETWCSLGWTRDGRLLARVVDHFGAGSRWIGEVDDGEQIAAPDALWTAALVRDRARAAARLADVLPGRDVQAAAEVAARCVHAELDREARVAARPVRGAMVEAGIARWLARRKRREPATRRRWAIMAQRRPCELVPPEWWAELRRWEEYRYDAGAELAAAGGVARG